MKNSRKKDILRKFLEKRIKDNKKLFTDKELKIIKENFNIIKKIYILGIKAVSYTHLLVPYQNIYELQYLV